MSQVYNEIARYAASPVIFFLRAPERNPRLDKVRLLCQHFFKFAVLIPVERTIRPTLPGQFIDLLIQFVSLRYLPADRSVLSVLLIRLIDRLDAGVKENWNALQADLVGEVSNPALIQAKAELIERQREQLLILIEEHGKRNPPDNFTPGGDPPICAEYVEMHRKYLAAGDDLRLAFADVEVQNAEVNIPGGIVNGGNRCYIHVVLQALSYVYSSSIEALRDDHPLSFLKEPIEALRKGELISQAESLEIAEKLRNCRCLSDPEGKQGCSIELLGNILGQIEASMMQMQIPINLTGEVTETKSEVEEGQVIPFQKNKFIN